MIVAVVVLTLLIHRYNEVCGHRTGSNNSGAGHHLRRKTNKNRRQYTQKLEQIVYLRQKNKTVMICLGDGRKDQTQGKKEKKRKEEGRDTELKNKQNKISISMSSWWGKGDTRYAIPIVPCNRRVTLSVDPYFIF